MRNAGKLSIRAVPKTVVAHLMQLYTTAPIKRIQIRVDKTRRADARRYFYALSGFFCYLSTDFYEAVVGWENANSTCLIL